ncbi:MAG: response regulator transcription factor [Actinomycetota bacterium]
MSADVGERILVVEDDTSTRRALVFSLEDEGARVASAATGAAALDEARAVAPDAVLLDLGLPDMTGVEVLRELRSFSDAPVIVVSAHLAEEEKVAALDAGADDYVTKPYSVNELLARLRAHTRRARGKVARDSLVAFGDVRIDLVRREVTRGTEVVSLTRTEFALLEYLARRANRVCTHDELLEHVWGRGQGPRRRESLWTYVKRLRAALEVDPQRPEHLVRHFGIGYSLVVPSAEEDAAGS